MPFDRFRDFDDCVAKMKAQGHDDESARRLCGRLQADAERARMADFNSQWVEIFQAGDYGEKGVFTNDDLDRIVRNFKPDLWRPVAIIGHDERDPALGQVKALKREGTKLLAQFEHVHPLLESAVAEGRYPSRSVGLYRNPEGAGWMLRHVAFLGAVPPEVKGLKPIQFRDGEYVSFESSTQEERMAEEKTAKLEEQVSALTRLFEGFKKLFVGDAVSAAPPAAALQFDEAKFNELIEAKLKPLREENAQLRAELAQASTASALARFDERVQSLAREGRIVPAISGTIRLLRERVAQGGTVKFTEGEGENAREIEQPVLDFALAELAKFVEIVPLGELAGKAKALPGAARFNEAPGIAVDPLSVALAERARALMGERKIDFGQALRLAREEQTA